ncbi:hypothetical protein NHX12_015372, partial [Muraenolepis orangiensis]
TEWFEGCPEGRASITTGRGVCSAWFYHPLAEGSVQPGFTGHWQRGLFSQVHQPLAEGSVQSGLPATGRGICSAWFSSHWQRGLFSLVHQPLAEGSVQPGLTIH